MQQAIQALADAHDQRLTPDIVVESARNPESPLHARFEWDDTKAADEHRRAQARMLIRSIKVEYRTTTMSFEAPAFVREPGLGHMQGYISVGRLRTQEDAARSAIVAEFARASAALRRAQEIAKALGMEDQIALLEAQIVRLGDALSDQAAPAN